MHVCMCSYDVQYTTLKTLHSNLLTTTSLVPLQHAAIAKLLLNATRTLNLYRDHAVKQFPTLYVIVENVM